MKRQVLLLPIVLWMGVRVAPADTIFVGIGNDGFKRDIGYAVNAIKPYATVLSAEDQNQGMLTELNNGAAKLNPNNPDVLIFYYAGHGQVQDDPNDKGDKDLLLGTFDKGTTPVTDDQLTSVISTINGNNPKAGVMIIIDSCYAGQAVDDNNDLQSVDASVVGSARKDECAGEQSAVAAVFSAALNIKKGNFEADLDHDGKVTLGELLSFMSSNVVFYENKGTRGTPFFFNFGSNNTDAVVAVLPKTPEPCTILLFLTGGIGATLVMNMRSVIRRR